MHDTPDASAPDVTTPDDIDEGFGLTHQERTSAHREPMLLFDMLANLYPAPARREAGGLVEMRRTPDRCVLQAESLAVTVSWFAPRMGATGAGELQIITWKGTVTMPGTAPRAGAGATKDTIRVLQLPRVEGSKGGWRGEPEGHGKKEKLYTSDDLVSLCAKLLPTAGSVLG